MAEVTLSNTWANVDKATTMGNNKPYFDAYQLEAETLSITAGTPQSPAKIGIRVQDSIPFINHFVGTGTSLQYTGAETRTFELSFSGSIYTDQNNHLITALGGMNGVPDYTTSIDRKIGRGSDLGSVAGSFFLRLSTNDYVDVYFDSSVNADITVTKGLYNIRVVD